MSVLKSCKDQCFNDIDIAIEYVKEHNYHTHIILYHLNETLLYQMIDTLYRHIKEYNKGLILNEQVRPTNPYYFRDIDEALGVQCAEISMDCYEDTKYRTTMFYGGYNNYVLDLSDMEQNR